MTVLKYNEIVQALADNTRTKEATAWSVIGEPDVFPPDFASEDLTNEVPRVECDDGYGNMRLVRHFKPDAVLAEMQSPLRKVVAPLDAHAIGSDDFEEAAQTKIDARSPWASIEGSIDTGHSWVVRCVAAQLE